MESSFSPSPGSSTLRERERGYWAVGVNWNNVSLLAVGFESFLLADRGDVTPVRGGRGDSTEVCVLCV